MLVMNENSAEKLEGLSGVKNRFGLRLSLAKINNAMFIGLLVGFEMITEESYQIVKTILIRYCGWLGVVVSLGLRL